MTEYRTGIGYDRHLLVPGGPLVLGGIEIPHSKKLTGHSDGDVLLHAVADAVLGACALGDLGSRFSDTDPRWKGVKSEFFLKEIYREIKEKGFQITFVDGIILAETPKLSPFFYRIKENLSRILGLPVERVSIKAKTEEKTGSIGREESMAAFAAATAKREDSGGF